MKQIILDMLLGATIGACIAFFFQIQALQERNDQIVDSLAGMYQLIEWQKEDIQTLADAIGIK